MSNDNINKELEKAVKDSNLEKVKALLSEGANPNHTVEWNKDPLLHITGSVEITKELLLGGARVNETNMWNDSPLHSAITQGKNVEIVRELLKHGAYVNATNRKGNTALNCAVKKGTIGSGVIEELLKYGADINIRNRERRCFENCASSLDNAITTLYRAKLLIKYTLIRNFHKDYGKIINLSPYKEHYNYSKLSSYLDDCVCEIVQMKTEDKQLFQFVTNNFNIQAPYNNQLSVRLAKIDYSDYSIRYPIYNDIILENVKLMLERADLLNKLKKIQFYTVLDMTERVGKENKIILDHDSTYNITEYLSNDHLRSFIAALDDSNKHALQSSNSLSSVVEPGTKLCEPYISNEAKRPKLE